MLFQDRTNLNEIIVHQIEMIEYLFGDTSRNYNVTVDDPKITDDKQRTFLYPRWEVCSNK